MATRWRSAALGRDAQHGTATSRSLGPALFAGGDPLAHVWLFLIAPLIGGALAAGIARLLVVPAVTAGAPEPATVDRTGAELPGDAAGVSRPGSAPDDSGAAVRSERRTRS